MSTRLRRFSSVETDFLRKLRPETNLYSEEEIKFSRYRKTRVGVLSSCIMNMDFDTVLFLKNLYGFI